MQFSNTALPDIPSFLYKSHLQFITNSNGTQPLWRSKNDTHPEYFEVEILTDKNEDLLCEKSIDHIINLNKYTCPICNVDVPKTYMKEHHSSVKHTTCSEITNLALERAKLQMQLEIPLSRKLEIVDTYFCDPCATVILNSDKKTHEKSKTHKVSLKHDELLNELLKAYSNIDNVDVESEIDELEALKIELESAQNEESVQNVEPENTEIESLGNKQQNMEFRVDLDLPNQSKNTEVESIEKKLQNMELWVDLDLPNQPKNIEIESLGNKQQNMELWVDMDLPNQPKNIEIESLGNKQQNMELWVDLDLPNQPKNTEVESIEKKLQNMELQENLEDALKNNEKFAGDKATHDEINNIKDFIKVISEEADTLFENANTLIAKANKTYNNDASPKNAKKQQRKKLKAARKISIDTSIHESNNNEIKMPVVKEKFRTENIKQLNDFSKKIDEVMARYFDNNCTVDALNYMRDDKECGRNMKKLKRYQRDENEIKNCHQESDNINNTVNNEPKEIQNKPEEIVKTEKQEHQSENKHTENNNNKVMKDIQNIEHDKSKGNKEIKGLRKHNQQKTTEIKHHKEFKKQNNQKTPVKSQPSIILINYLKDIARKTQTQTTHTVTALTDTLLEVTAMNGDKLKIPVNNFHSFHVKAHSTYCMVCEVPNVGRLQWHISNGEHVAKIMAPIRDKDGIRQLDDIWSHCILCNDLTKNVDFHLKSLLHRNKLKHCLIELAHTNSNHESEGDRQYAHTTNRDGHIESLITQHNLVLTNKDYLNCITCEVIVNQDRLSIDQHVNSFDHLNNVELFLEENRLMQLDAEKLYCISCDSILFKAQMFSHCNGRKHKKLLQEHLSKQGLETEQDATEILLPSISQNVKVQVKSKIEDSELICFVCNVIIYYIVEHMDSFDHKKRYFSYLEANKLNEIAADTFYCIPCNTVITIDFLMSHCTCRKHRVTLKNFTGNSTDTDKKHNGNSTDKKHNNIENSKSSPSRVSPTNAKDKVMPLKVLYQFREMTDPTKLLCTVCDEELLYKKRDAERHVSTLDHVVAFNLMMLWNKIKKRDDKYFCDICRIDMTYFSEITHVLGRQHVNNLAKEPKGTVYEYDKTLVTHAYAMSHKVGSRTRLSSVVAVKSNDKPEITLLM